MPLVPLAPDAPPLARMLTMPRLLLVSLAGLLTLVTIVPAARGEVPHAIGRYLGMGWSDGYHSRTACPPKRHIVHHQPTPAPAPIPWWKIPAEGAEALPAPAAQQPDTTRSFPPSGPSLFRQPGEGSSVTVSSTPNPTAASR
jgi:hypothetical protein